MEQEIMQKRKTLKWLATLFVGIFFGFRWNILRCGLIKSSSKIKYA